MDKILVDRSLMEQIYDAIKDAQGTVIYNEYNEEVIDYFTINDELKNKIKNTLK